MMEMAASLAALKRVDGVDAMYECRDVCDLYVVGSTKGRSVTSPSGTPKGKKAKTKGQSNKSKPQSSSPSAPVVVQSSVVSVVTNGNTSKGSYCFLSIDLTLRVVLSV